MEQDEKVKVQTKLRSPTMPNLIEYKPLKNQRVTEQVNASINFFLVEPNDWRSEC